MDQTGKEREILMKKWLLNLTKIPLLWLLVITAALFTGLAAYGKDRLYMPYTADRFKEPMLSIVFKGIHGEDYPWQVFTDKKEEAAHDERLDQLLLQLGDIQDSAVKTPEPQAKTEDPEKDVNSGAEKDGTDTGSEKDPEEGSGKVWKNGEKENTGKDTEDAQSAKQENEQDKPEKTGHRVKTQKEEPEEEPGEETEGEPEEEPEEETDPRFENPTFILADSMPEEVNCPVMQAADYGVANRRFMVADGTEFNTDTEGIFAENGEYYRFRAVNDYYFSDALFVGNSRTDGLKLYGGFQDSTTFLSKESTTVYNLFDKQLRLSTPDGSTSTMTLLDLLFNRQFRKIYIGVGVNELGIPDTAAFYQKYREAVAVIRQLQPDAIIYIQGIMHVTQKKSMTDKAINNTVIVQRNEAIASLANGRDIFYLDMNPYFCDEDGNLRAELTNDGVHLKATAYTAWHDFLVEHGIWRSADDFTGTGPIMEGVKIPGVTVPLEEEDE